MNRSRLAVAAAVIVAMSAPAVAESGLALYLPAAWNGASGGFILVGAKEDEAKKKEQERAAQQAREQAATRERAAQQEREQAAARERAAQQAREQAATRERAAQQEREQAATRERAAQQARDQAATRERAAQQARDQAATRERAAQQEREQAAARERATRKPDPAPAPTTKPEEHRGGTTPTPPTTKPDEHRGGTTTTPPAQKPEEHRGGTTPTPPTTKPDEHRGGTTTTPPAQKPEEHRGGTTPTPPTTKPDEHRGGNTTIPPTTKPDEHRGGNTTIPPTTKPDEHRGGTTPQPKPDEHRGGTTPIPPTTKPDQHRGGTTPIPPTTKPDEHRGGTTPIPPTTKPDGHRGGTTPIPPTTKPDEHRGGTPLPPTDNHRGGNRGEGERKPPVQRPSPIIVPPVQPNPGQPGRGERQRMPERPKPIQTPLPPASSPPSRIKLPPERHEGEYRDRNGRVLPPNREHLGRIDNAETRRRMNEYDNDRRERDGGYYRHRWGNYDAYHYWDGRMFWWLMYVNGVAFRTRYWNGDILWDDPYTGRTLFLRDGQWWYQDIFGNMYIYSGGFYNRYDPTPSGVVIVPEVNTPYVEQPPVSPDAPPAPSASFSSMDAALTVSIQGDDQSAYLYNNLVTDPEDPRSKGVFLAAGVKEVVYRYIDQEVDGDVVKTVQQIELTFNDSADVAIFDLNGEREVIVGDGAVKLYRLYDAVPYPLDIDGNDPRTFPATLGEGFATVQMANGSDIDAAGNPLVRVLQIKITLPGADGSATIRTYDRDGGLIDESYRPGEAPVPAGSAQQIQELENRLNRILQQLGSDAAPL